MSYDTQPKEPYRPLVWNDAVLDIQDALLDFDTPIYIVGGAVRNAMLSRPIKDLDLATPGDSIAIARTVANTLPNGDFFVMDQERGVARAIIDTMHGPMNVDVARFRGDQPDDLVADLLDRDFTMNAMTVPIHGDLSQIIDPLSGEADVASKVVRLVRPGAISDDPVRALRGIRQSVQLGFQIEPDTLREIRAAAGTLTATVSPERVRDEFFNILALKRPVGALRVMNAIGLLQDVIGWEATTNSQRRSELLTELDKLSNLLNGLVPSRRGNTISTDFGYGLALMQLNAIRAQLEAQMAQEWPNGRPHLALLLLTTLLRDDPERVSDLAETMRLSNAEKQRMTQILRADESLLEGDTPLSNLGLHRFWYVLEEAGVDVCLMALARFLAEQGPGLNQDAWLQFVEQVRGTLEAYFLKHDEIVQPPQLVDGSSLMNELDIAPGPRIGKLLDIVREAQVLGEVATQQEALALVSSLLDAASQDE